MLGELYYYDKKLDEINLPLAEETLSNLQIVGVELEFLNKLKDQPKASWPLLVRDEFKTHYGQMLKEQNLDFASWFWSVITSPLLPTKDTVIPRTVFQVSLLEWIESGLNFFDLDDLIPQGSLTVELEDFAIYYGLRVIHRLTYSNEHDNREVPEPLDQTSIQDNYLKGDNLTLEPEIIVITSTSSFPLFKNINCVVLESEPDFDSQLHSLNQLLLQNSQIKMIILETYREGMVQFLRKRIDPKILITSIRLSHENQSDFFAKIVKDTLGIRLT